MCIIYYPRGYETVMDESIVKENICKYLKEGLFKKDSAVMSGISEATFYRWLDEDESFKSQVEASVLEYKLTLIKNITTCAKKDGRLALEVLKRRFPNDWIDNQNNDDSRDIKRIADMLENVYIEGNN